MHVRRMVSRNPAFAVLAALATIGMCLFAGQNGRFLLRAAPSPNPQHERGATGASGLPFRLSHGLLVVIKGRIGDVGNLRFALDTGTTQTIVDRRVADQLHLSCRPAGPVFNFNRIISLQKCSLPDLQIGSFRVTGLTVRVARLTELSMFLDGADAVLGLDLLGSSKFTVDYASDEVVFERLDQPVPVVRADPDDPIAMTVVIQVQGHPIRLIVDTGVEGVVLFENRLRKRIPLLHILGRTEAVSIGKSLQAKRVTLPGVRFGTAETNCEVFLISEPPKNSLAGIDGFLGVSVLGARRLTLDFIGKTMTWER